MNENKSLLRLVHLRKLWATALLRDHSLKNRRFGAQQRPNRPAQGALQGLETKEPTPKPDP